MISSSGPFDRLIGASRSATIRSTNRMAKNTTEKISAGKSFASIKPRQVCEKPTSLNQR